MERYKHLKETLMCAIEGQCANLATADTKELGEAIDMVKDLEEAMYYASITKAMKEEEHAQEGKYYHPIAQVDKMYYDGRDGRRGFTEYAMGEEPMEYARGRGGNRSYMEYAQDGASNRYADYNRYNDGMSYARDQREGRSGMSRRSYMEGKELRKDKQAQMRELEKYMQELSADMVEMIEHSSPEEKQYLEKKLAALSQKVAQVND